MLKEKWSKTSIRFNKQKNFWRERFLKIKEIFNFRKNSVKKMLNIVLLLLALAVGVYFEWNVIEIIILLIFVGIVFHPIPSRILAMPALGFLIITSFLIIFKENEKAKMLAGELAVYAYYFLVMAVVMGIYEVRKDSKKIKQK